MVAMVGRFVFVFIVVFQLHGTLAVGTEGYISDVLNDFRQRIELLEARDAAKDIKIAELESEISGLKSKMAEMDTAHRQKEAALQDQIDTLERAMEQSFDDIETERNTGPTENDSDLPPPTPNRIRRQKHSIRTNRDIPEAEVAFYVTHTHTKIHNLGANQVLQFQQAVTNIGHAYNTHTGAFVAPVNGTYVFHATVRGIDMTSHNFTRAHFDVDGTKYSEFISFKDQASQMLVINLKTGQTVSVRNTFTDNGFMGQHFSTFSGFLLYQSYPASGVIVG